MENAEESVRRKIIERDLLKMTDADLNYLLCRFIFETRKADGSEFQPDSIYFMMLCIQSYLKQNNRSTDIFYDTAYERFADCFEEIARKFSIYCQSNPSKNNFLIL